MFYKYTVGWYDCYIDEERHDEGVVFARDWNQAADRVAESYGHDNVFDLYLKELLVEDGDYCLSKEDIEYAFKKD